jgi:hypothetical protein
MSIDTFFLMVATFSFLIVSITFAIKLIIDGYLEYLQVRTGIEVITVQREKELQQAEKYDEDEEEGL